MRSFSNFILRRAGIIAVLGTLLAFVGGYYSVQLYKNLRTNFEELLPTTARSVIDLNEVQRRLLAIDNLAVLAFSNDTQASKRFVIDLARKLESLPPGIVAKVEYNIAPELKFFKDRQALYMDLEDLKKIRDYMRDKIEYETSLYNPLNIFSEVEIPEPRLDFMGMKQKYASNLSTYERFPGGFYATPDEKKRAILVYMAGEASNIEKDAQLKKTVAGAVAELNPKAYAKDLEIHYTGGVQDTLEEHEALIEDLELSTVVVMVMVTIAMLIFYRAVRATMALVISLLMGTLWTFGASYFAVGYLNANSAFLGSIVLGNGINFGIILLARYMEERRNGGDNSHAITISMSHTATATATAALGAGLSYGSLMVTSFRGFNQFGVIGLIGMVLCWLSAFTLLPAYLTVMDRMGMLKNISKRKAPTPYISNAVAGVVHRVPRLVWGLSLLATFASMAMLTRYKPDILETNLRNLRNKHSLEHGSAHYGKELDAIFQRFLNPLVILPYTNEQAEKIAALLKERQKAEGKKSMIASVQTLHDFIPKVQKEKIEVLKEIRALLTPRILNEMSSEDRKQVQMFLTDAAMSPVEQKDLPKLVLSKFTEKDGSIGKLVLIEPPVTGETDKGELIVPFIRGLREVADQVAPKAPVAGTTTITADMVEAISKDGPKATLVALIAVVILVVVLFRNIVTVSLILSALFLGMLWLAGWVLGSWFKINFLNFIALPITFGIGVDYGVNMFERYREEGGANILKVIRSTGGAVLLCSFTTVVGYGSLLIAGNQGFVSFGTLAVVGELTCVVAAVLTVPAFLYLRHRK